MSKERESEIELKIKPYHGMDACRLLAELLTERRERHRTALENDNDEQVRGRAKECRDLLRMLEK